MTGGLSREPCYLTSAGDGRSADPGTEAVHLCFGAILIGQQIGLVQELGWLHWRRTSLIVALVRQNAR